ncbi:hypothetical protein CASFOL_028844 [Castilleja foliolosa]|uniref:Uncharacterized protein n=1 Tax=Castilleja foliolosa TaxID=1961234 RepID=A0ABD3CDU4_9LAMI
MDEIPIFPPSTVELDGGKTLDLSNYPNIFMSDGSINGYYYDPNSSAMKQGRRAETL